MKPVFADTYYYLALIIPLRQAAVRSPMIVFVEPPGTEVFIGF